MLLPSEIEAKYTIPALRAFIAKRLISEYGFTQEQVAKAMGLTQAAVSNYIRGVRGIKMELEKNAVIEQHIKEIVEMIVENSGDMKILKKINETLLDLRKKRILCEIHRIVEPRINISDCEICEDHFSDERNGGVRPES